MESKKLEEMLDSPSLVKNGFQYAKNSMKNPYVRAGLGVGAMTIATTLLGVNDVYANQGNLANAQETYGFFSGLWDGLLWLPNLAIDVFADSTFASDGNGVYSTPNTGPGYWLGFVMMGGGEGLFGAILGGDD